VSDLSTMLGPELVAAIEQLVEERVARALARRGDATAKRWLSVPEAGEYLGCSRKAVYARIERGRIPDNAVRRMGRTVTIDRHALDRTLDR
jgi:excisionase family DNA binding protein